MKLQKALKLRKSLVGEITKLKTLIKNKNSYLVGNEVKIDVNDVYAELLDKVNQLVGLKYAINQANLEIQDKIYILSEQKALIAFWSDVSVVEGIQAMGYSEHLKEYKAQIDEVERDKKIKEIQLKVDALQEEIDTYNYTTDIPWDEPLPEVKNTKVVEE